MSSSYPGGFVREHNHDVHSRTVPGTDFNEKHVDLLAYALLECVKWPV